MESFFDFAEFVLKRGKHEHILCPAVQFASWWRRFRTCTKKVEDGARKTEIGVKENSWNILSDSVRYGVFRGRPFGAGEVFGYYGTSVYTNLATKTPVRESMVMASCLSLLTLFLLGHSRFLIRHWIAHRRIEVDEYYRLVSVARHLLTIVFTFLKTGSRRFNVTLNHERTPYVMCKSLPLTTPSN